MPACRFRHHLNNLLSIFLSLFLSLSLSLSFRAQCLLWGLDLGLSIWRPKFNRASKKRLIDKDFKPIIWSKCSRFKFWNLIPRPANTDPWTCLIWMDWTRWTGLHIWIGTDVKQMSWDVKSADMKYLATMAKNERVPLIQKKRKKR